MTQGRSERHSAGGEFRLGEQQQGGCPRYREYKDSSVVWLGRVPAHWFVLPLKRLGALQAGSGFPDHEQGDLAQEIPFFKVGDMGSTSNVREMLQWQHTVSRKTALNLRAHVIPADTVVFAKVGAALLLNRRRILVRPSCIDNNMMGFVPFCCDPIWAFYLLSAFDIGVLANPGAVPSVNEGQMRDSPVAVPPLPEQRAIAVFLDRETAKIDALVAKKERLIKLLQEKRTALITRAVTKGLEPEVPMKDSGVEWPAKVPRHWELYRAKRLSSFVTSGSRGWATYYTDEGPLFLRIGNLRSGCIDLDLEDVQRVSPPKGAEGERTRVQAGDILISITALIGAVAVVNDNICEAYVNQHLALLRPTADRIESRWLAHSLASIVGQSQFQEALYGGTKDGLGLEDIRTLFVLAPPLSEQRMIAAFLDRQTVKIDALAAKIQEGIDRLNELRITLISAAVTGKIDVRDYMDANPRPAS